MSLVTLVAVCAVVTFSATALASQTSPEATAASNAARRDSVLSQLSFGTKVRVETIDGILLKGRFARIDGESLLLYSPGRDAPRLPLVRIDTLWVHGRSHGKGFINGALIGGVAGTIGVGLLAYGISHGTNESCNCGETIVRDVAVTTFVGGVIGAAVGWPGWRQWWPR